MAPGGKLLQEGDLVRRPTLADTLEMISEQGFNYFYSSNMTRDLVEEINGLGGNFSVKDFASYSVIERNVTESSYAGFPLLSTPPPSAGAVLSMILSVLEGTLVPCDPSLVRTASSCCYNSFTLAHLQVMTSILLTASPTTTSSSPSSCRMPTVSYWVTRHTTVL